jgi:hypothetical protein
VRAFLEPALALTKRSSSVVTLLETLSELVATRRDHRPVPASLARHVSARLLVGGRGDTGAAAAGLFARLIHDAFDGDVKRVAEWMTRAGGGGGSAGGAAAGAALAPPTAVLAELQRIAKRGPLPPLPLLPTAIAPAAASSATTAGGGAAAPSATAAGGATLLHRSLSDASSAIGSMTLEAPDGAVTAVDGDSEGSDDGPACLPAPSLDLPSLEEIGAVMGGVGGAGSGSTHAGGDSASLGSVRVGSASFAAAAGAGPAVVARPPQQRLSAAMPSLDEIGDALAVPSGASGSAGSGDCGRPMPPSPELFRADGATGTGGLLQLSRTPELLREGGGKGASTAVGFEPAATTAPLLSPRSLLISQLWTDGEDGGDGGSVAAATSAPLARLLSHASSASASGASASDIDAQAAAHRHRRLVDALEHALRPSNAAGSVGCPSALRRALCGLLQCALLLSEAVAAASRDDDGAAVAARQALRQPLRAVSAAAGGVRDPTHIFPRPTDVTETAWPILCRLLSPSFCCRPGRTARRYARCSAPRRRRPAPTGTTRSSPRTSAGPPSRPRCSATTWDCGRWMPRHHQPPVVVDCRACRRTAC